MRRLLLLPLALVCASALADTNLAMTCWDANPPAVRPSSCPQGWTWRAPKLNSMVITQGGSWRQITQPLASEPITLCKANVLVGTARATCPAASIVYLPPCNAAGLSCTVTPPPVDEPIDNTATVDWTNPTLDTGGQPVGQLLANTLYRGVKTDGSDQAKYRDLPVSTTFVDLLLAPGTWCYSVSATNAAGPSAKSTPVGCKVIKKPAVIVLTPAAPSSAVVK